jgi:thioredoxin-like negative regulator of GroEL
MKPQEISSVEALRQAINKEYCLVYCNTPWSAPCQKQYPILVKVAASYIGWGAIVQVDIERHPDVAAELTIQSIPTIVVFHKGREIHRFVGLQPLETLLKALDTILPVGLSARFNE